MKNYINTLRKHYFKIGLTVAFGAAFIFRAFLLSGLPNFVHVDEAALGYNAWCLAHFGVDRYLNEMPIYPQNYYGGQSPLYTYLLSLLILTVGRGNLSLFITRLPGLIFSMLVVIFSTKTIYLIFGNKNLTLVCAFLTGAFPILIMQGRVGLDCNLMLGCCVLAIYSTAKYASSQKKTDLCLCGAAFGLVMYSYALSYIVVPLCLCFFALYMLFVKKINIPRTILWAASVCIISMPILLFIFSLLFKLKPFKFLIFDIYPFASGRMTTISLQNFWSKVWRSIIITLTDGDYIVDSIPKFGTMYYTSIPFILIGFFASLYHFVVSLKKRRFHYSSLFVLFYISCLITMGLVKAHLYRANFFFAAYIYFLILGIYSVYNFIHTYHRAFVIVLSGGYLLWAASFLNYYFRTYESVVNPIVDSNPLYYIPAIETITYAETELCPKTIYIDAGYQEVQLFYSPISPYEWTDMHDDYGYDHYNFILDYATSISTENVYIVRKGNTEFITMINNFDIPHETLEYEYYYLFYFISPFPEYQPQ